MHVSSRNQDGSFKVKDATASIDLEIEEGAEESNKMITPGSYIRLVNPKMISKSKISMAKKSSSGVTKPFPLGANLSPVKEEEKTMIQMILRAK